MVTPQDISFPDPGGVASWSAMSGTRDNVIVVVGAGHAGCEAALAAARMGARVCLVTLDPLAVARMSCNPSLGGLGKGQLVRELDALGGQMGLAGDATGIHFRRLNQRKGAAVRATRVQSDRAAYAAAMGRALERQPGVELCQGEVTLLELQGGRVQAVILADGARIPCRAALLTTGTFLGGKLHVGLESRPGGRDGEPAAAALSACLAALGLELGRLKTGTPCRLHRGSIDYSRLAPQPGDDPPPRLSCWSRWPQGRPPLRQVPCHITHTNPRTHELIRSGLDRSPLYAGVIQGTGPRYCPSIEDKVVRFPDRERHQIFLEPEGLDVDEVYPNGISTSLPLDLQEQLVHSIAGLEEARILRPGYAVEYDYVDPRQLTASLQVRDMPGLYLAGQINGTSGYEEAAAQGMLAGINAALSCRGDGPLLLGRDQAFMGVMVDDLVTRGAPEPYRMFTSRAEYRLILREDNAPDRLTPVGRELGLIDDERWARFCRGQERRRALAEQLQDTRAHRSPEADAGLAAAESSPTYAGATLAELLRRPELSLALLEEAGLLSTPPAGLTAMDREQVEVECKYDGYIQRQLREAARLGRLEQRRIPDDLDYASIPGLRCEVREKLSRQRPATLGQASRIPGITPAAVAIIEVLLRRR